MYKPKIVLMGMGNFGKNHLRVLKELEIQSACKLFGVVDIKGETLKVIGKGHKFKTSVDFHDFLKDDVSAKHVVAGNTENVIKKVEKLDCPLGFCKRGEFYPWRKS